LTFFYEDPENVCGVETEGEGIFTNTIVVQQHPVIQQVRPRSNVLLTKYLYSFVKVTIAITFIKVKQ
jgi:hypothetical protein